jgi:hypothetical protein
MHFFLPYGRTLPCINAFLPANSSVGDPGCLAKYHKIVNYFIFELEKKKYEPKSKELYRSTSAL